jgi:uncharacterized protein (DUF3820 family)
VNDSLTKASGNQKLAARTFSKLTAHNYFFSTMNAENAVPDPDILRGIVSMRMPFGKYKGTVLCDLPVSYLEWFAREGFPAGKLGMMLATLFEIKTNGLMYLLDPLRK